MATALNGASARQTLGAVLGVVTETASVISSTMQAASGAASMLNVWVNDAKSKQLDRSKITMHNYRNQLIEDSALQNSIRRNEIKRTLDADENLKQIFEVEYENINKLFSN